MSAAGMPHRQRPGPPAARKHAHPHVAGGHAQGPRAYPTQPGMASAPSVTCATAISSVTSPPPDVAETHRCQRNTLLRRRTATISQSPIFLVVRCRCMAALRLRAHRSRRTVSGGLIGQARRGRPLEKSGIALARRSASPARGHAEQPDDRVTRSDKTVRDLVSGSEPLS